MDYGSWDTDMRVLRLERRIKEIYSEASKDIDAKMKDFNDRYKVKEAIYKKQVKDGKITQEDFDAWKRGQVFQGQQWEAKKASIEDVLTHANETAQKMVNGEKTKVFVANSNYQAYQLEHSAGVDFGFNLYDSATVTRLIEEQPNLLPYPSVNVPKDKLWNSRNISRQIAQGIIQGESLDKIAKRLSKETGSKNMNSMLTNARTAMTGAQNAGRIVRLAEAKGKGIKVKKEWMATLDEHTRWQHADLDGQKVETDQPFKIGGYTIMYPGDPHAHPSMIYNCRCTLVGDLEDYPSEYERYDNIEGKPIKNMTYREWEKAKGVQYSKSRIAPVVAFNQVSIGACKTVQEVNNLLNGRGLWRYIGNGIESKADLTGCDLDSVKSIAASYEQVFAKYPQLKGKLDAPNAHPKGMEDNTYAWCYTRNGGRVEVNPTYYSNWNNITRQYEQDVISGWHPKGTTAESIVTHEIGHAIDGLLAQEGVLGGYTKSGEFRYASSSIKSTIMKRAAKNSEELSQALNMWPWDKKRSSTYAIEEYVSRYATKNAQEWFAECFAEYITSANPRIVATEFGKELEKLLDKLED